MSSPGSLRRQASDVESPVVIWRGGRRQRINVTLGTLPGNPARPPSTAGQPRASSQSGLGLSVGPVHPSLLSSVSGDRGAVVITALDPDGQAARAGLERGDVVLDINGRATASVESFQRQVGALRAGQVARLRVIRDRRPIFIAFEYGG